MDYNTIFIPVSENNNSLDDYLNPHNSLLIQDFITVVNEINKRRKNKAYLWGRITDERGEEILTVPQENFISESSHNPADDSVTIYINSLSKKTSKAYPKPKGDWELIDGFLINIDNKDYAKTIAVLDKCKLTGNPYFNLPVKRIAVTVLKEDHTIGVAWVYSIYEKVVVSL